RRVAGAALDRDLADRVEDRPQARELPEVRPGEEAETPAPAERDPDHHRIPLAVVVWNHENRPGARHRLQPTDPQPRPPGDRQQEAGDRGVEHAGQPICGPDRPLRSARMTRKWRYARVLRRAVSLPGLVK